MGVNGVSIFSQIVIKDLKKDLGKDFEKTVGVSSDTGAANGAKGDVTAKAWDYFLNNYDRGRYVQIMKDLKNAGFEYPFDVCNASGSDRSLIAWVNKTNRELDSRGMKDSAEKAKEFYLRLIAVENGGRSVSEGGLDIKLCDRYDESFRPMGDKMPFAVFSQTINGERFDQCTEFVHLYVSILRLIGIEAHAVYYSKGDYGLIPNRWFSFSKGLKSWKEMDKELSKTEWRHAYAFFRTSGGQMFVADVNGVFEKINKPVDHYLSPASETETYYTQQGAIFSFQGKQGAGEEKIKVALEISPDDALAHCNLGNIYRISDRKKEAIAEYNAAKRIDPGLPQAHSGLAMIYEAMQMYDKAIEEYQAVIGVNPDEENAHYALGRLYIAVRQHDKAEKEEYEVIRINPALSGPYYVLAEIYAAYGRNDEAIANLKRAVSLDANIIERAKVDPNLKGLRSDERFIKLIAGII